MPPLKKNRQQNGFTPQQHQPTTSSSAIAPITNTTSTLPQPSNAEELQQVLQSLLSSDNTLIQQATEIMKQFQKQPSSVPALMQQLSEAPSREARQMAAVLLRRKILPHYPKLNPQMHSEIKKTLLARLEHESDRLVRHNVAALISTLSKITVPAGQWNELPTFLMQWSKSPDAQHRELSMLLFRALAENIGKSLKPHFKQLQQVFTTGLQDQQSEKVRIEAVYALGVLVDLIDNENALGSFKQSIPPLLQVVHLHLQHGDEDLISAAFETLETLAYAPQNILDPYYTQLLPLMMEVAVNTQLDVNIREKASGLAVSFIEGKPKQITKSKLVEPLLHSAVKLLCEPDEECWESEGDEVHPQRIGLEILDTLALNIPRKFIFAPAMQLAAQFMQSQNHHERKAGLIILCAIAEGCADSLRPQLEQIMPPVCAALSDQSPLVRTSACVTLCQLSEQLQPDIKTHHHTIVPKILQIFDNPQESLMIRSKAIIALQVFLEILEEDVVQYSDTIMQRIVPLLQQEQQNVPTEMREQAINCITAIASAAGEKFEPYFSGTAQLLAQFMQLQEDETLTQRCYATVCMGAVALAVGKDRFMPYLTDCMRVVVAGMTLDYFELREASYNFFSSIAQVLNDRDTFMPYVTTIMPLILATCLSDDGVMVSKKEGSFQSESEDEVDDDNEEILEGEEGDDDDYRRLRFSIRSGALDEKVAALNCMCHCIDVAAERFAPYLEKVLKVAEELSGYPHASVREGCVNVAERLCQLMAKLYPKDIVKGQATLLRPEVKPVVEPMVQLMYDVICEDDDKETCAVACEGVSAVLQLYGLAGVKKLGADKLVKQITKLLQEKAVCQQAEQDEEDSEIVADHDAVLIHSVTDLVADYAAAVGPSIDGQFKSWMPLLMKFYDSKRQSADRSMAIGCIAEVVTELGGALTGYLPKLMPSVLAGIQDNAVIVRRNACYCYGNIALSGLPAVTQTFSSTIPLLQQAVTSNVNRVSHAAHSDEIEDKSFTQEELDACHDNAVSAIGKVITATLTAQNPQLEQAINLPQLIPFYLARLPLRADQQEAKHAYNTVMTLYQIKTNDMMQYTPQVFGICSQVLGDADVDTQVQLDLTAFVKHLAQQVGPQATEQMMAQNVPAEHRERFGKFLTL